MALKPVMPINPPRSITRRPASDVSRSPNEPGPVTTPNQENSRISEKDESLMKMLRDLHQEGRSARAEFDTDWDKRYEFYRGLQWDRGRPMYKSAPVLNIIRTTIQSKLPLLTDNRPGFNVIPQEPGDFQFAQIVNDLIDAWWNKHEMDHTLVEVLMDSMIFDASILKISWDPEACNGKGDVIAEPVDPKDIYVPRGARDFTKDCAWVLHRSVKTVGYLKRKFPKMAKKIKADGNMRGDEDQSIRTDIHLVTPVDRKGYNFPLAGDTKDLRKTAEVWEVWMDSDELEEYQLAKDNGNEPETGYRKKYPKGRLVTCLPNQSIILQDIKVPYNHGMKPFIRFIDMILPRKFWGEGEVGCLMDQQRNINKAVANVMDYMNLMSNPVWITEQGNGVNPTRLTNAVGSVIQTVSGKGGSVKRDIPPMLTGGSINLVEWLLRQVESTSGVSDVTQGRAAGQVTAAAAIQTLQEAAQTRVRLAERNMAVSLSQLGKQVTSLMFQYYTEPRVIRLTGQEPGSWPQYFEFFTEPSGDPSRIRYNKKDYVWDPEARRYVEKPYESGETKGLMDIKVLAGTALPLARAQRVNVAFRLYDSKAIDQEELLKTLEWPDYEQVLQRLRTEGGEPLPAGQLPPPGAGVTQ